MEGNRKEVLVCSKVKEPPLKRAAQPRQSVIDPQKFIYLFTRVTSVGYASGIHPSPSCV